MGFQELALLLLLILPLCSSRNVFYVTPTPDTPCPAEPCHTLAEYVDHAEWYFTSNTSFKFLPGNHTLAESLSIKDVTNLALQANNPTPTPAASKIICSQPAFVSFDNVSKLHISSLAFISCGDGGSNAAVSLDSVNGSLIHFCEFQNSTQLGDGGGIAIKNSSIYLSFNSFINNIAKRGSGMYVYNSAVTITGSQFTDNIGSLDYGGGVYVESSVVDFDLNNFVKNVGFFGGAVYVTLSSVNFTLNFFEEHYGSSVYLESSKARFTRNTFRNNTAVNTSGAAVHTYDSYATFTGDSFTDNFADLLGGAVAVTNFSTVNFFRSSFQNNVANMFGGGAGVSYSAVNFTECSFIGNGATSGGSVASIQSEVNFITCDFSNSSAENGGAVYLTSILNFPTLSNILASTFINNTASFSGSGVYVYNSSVSIYGSVFMDNIVKYNIYTGSTVYVENSVAEFNVTTFMRNGILSVICVIRGLVSFTANIFTNQQSTVGVLLEKSVANFTNNIFTNNSRSPVFGFTFGAAVEVSRSFVTFTGDRFTGNNAGTGGAVGVFSAGPGYSTVSFFRNTFMNNSAVNFGGAVEVGSDIVNFTECVFVGNSANYTGGGVHVLDADSQVVFINCNFRNNFAGASGGALALSGNVTICGNSTVEDNRALYGGGGITVLDSLFYEANLTVTGNFLCKGNTADYGGCLAVGAGTVNISGGSEFEQNSANVYGGGIYAAASDLNLEGQNISFTHNSALSGGALLLASDSYVHLQSSTVVEFVHNSARKTGGAIEVQQGNPADNCVNYYTYVLPVPLSFCFFTVACSYDDTRLYFKDNTAMEGGGDIYGGSINNCSINLCDRGRRYGYPVFNEITSPKTETLSISSLPLHVYGCNESSNSPKIVYPGATLRVSVIAKGQRNGTISAVIKSDHTQGSVRINALQTVQSIPAECTSLMYTIFSLLTEDEVEFSLYAEGPCPQKQSYHFLHLKILECPPGFELSKVKQSCVCDSRLQPYTTVCYIDNGTVLRDGNFWVGYDNTSTSKGVILNSHCPFEYCVSEAIVLRVNDSDKQCENNRVGLLCGKCRENFSVVFGSSRCQYCTSGNQLKLLFLFVFAGIALVLVLFTLKLTVTVGTINGLIFYANLVQVNSSIFYPPGTHNILTVFIAWLNLDLGVEACFYSGMDTYAKTWLQFVFPIYVLALVGIIILFSHMSTGKIARKVNKNATSVLATLFLQSYAKFLLTAIAAMSVTYLDYPNGSTVAVWLYDGNIGYLKGKHIPLFVTAIAFFLFLLFPYTLLLFLGQWLPTYSCLGKIKPFLDAYYTPYTSGHRYWTGLLLLARCSLFLSFVILGNVGISLLATSSIIIGLFTLALLTGRVFKNPYIGALEGSFLLNLGVLAATTYHINLAGGNQAAATFTSIGIAFVTFIGIVAYHIFLQMKDMNYAWYSRPHSTKR